MNRKEKDSHSKNARAESAPLGSETAAHLAHSWCPVTQKMTPRTQTVNKI